MRSHLIFSKYILTGLIILMGSLLLKKKLKNNRWFSFFSRLNETHMIKFFFFNFKFRSFERSELQVHQHEPVHCHGAELLCVFCPSILFFFRFNAWFNFINFRR